MPPHKRQPTRPRRPWDSPGKNTGVGCHFLLQCMKVESESEVAQSCPTLSDPMDCSLPGSSAHGIFQARVLEWIAIAFSMKCKRCNFKKDRMISVCFQGKPFNITVIQVYAPTSNAEEDEVEWFSEDLQDLLELTPPKRCHVHYRGQGCQSRKSRDIWSNRQTWSWSTE